VLSVVQASAASDTAMAEVAFITLVLSVLIDCWGIGGPRWAPIFDRLAFLGWIVVWAVGFAGTGLTGLIAGLVTGVFEAIAGLWHAPLFEGGVLVAPHLLAWAVGLIAVGAMAPERWRFLGHLSKIKFEHLRTAGTAAMASTGITRAGPAAPVRAGGGWLRKMFPGSVNFGMVALALLFVTGATVIEGGIASAMNAGVQRDIQFMVWATHPLLGQIGHIK
jgi:hypothetical protein